MKLVRKTMFGFPIAAVLIFGSAPAIAGASPTGLRNARTDASAAMARRVAAHDHAVRTILAGGLALEVKDKSLPIPSKCGYLTLAHQRELVGLLLTASTGAHRGVVTMAGDRVAVEANSHSSTSLWVQTGAKGSLKVCSSGHPSVSMTLMAETTEPSAFLPGGFVNVSARIPLSVSGTRSGTVTLPTDTVPTGASGVLLQLSGGTAGLVQLRSSASALQLRVAVGPNAPAVTVLVPSGSLTWRSLVGSGAPQVIMLGFVTGQADTIDGGSRVHLVTGHASISASDVMLAGQFGMSAESSPVPPTGVIGSVAGTPTMIADPLAQGRQTPLGNQLNRRTDTFLRLGNSGDVQFSSSVNVGISAWLSGDLIRTTQAVDLSVPGSPMPTSAPTDSTLVFAGQPNFIQGDVLILPNSSVTPGGLIAVVSDVTSSGGTTTVTYTQGALLDAFDNLYLVSQVPATTAESSMVHRLHLHSNGSIGPHFSLGTLNLSKSASFGKDPTLSGNVSLSFSPSISLSISINRSSFLHLPDGVTMHYALDETSTLSASISVGGQLSLSQPILLGSVALGAVDVGPIWVTPELSAHLTLSAGVQAAITVAGSVSESAHVGFTLYAGVHGIHSSGDSNNGFGHPTEGGSWTPTVSVSASASAALTLQFTLAIESVAGPDASATAALEFDVNPGQTPWWALKAEGDFGIGIDLNALGIPDLGTVLNLLGIKADWTWTLGHLGPYTIASATGPAPSPLPIGGTGGTYTVGGSPGSDGGGPPGVVGGNSVGPIPSGSLAETTGGSVQTWTDYADAGGVEGPTIAPNQTLGISCRVHGFTVSDGNTWWYEISSSPWSSDYFASADAFYNDGQTAGSLHGTPFVDASVPVCQGQTGGSTSGGIGGTSETTGGVTHTWTNYLDAGGAEGPAINSNESVQIVCRVQGFQVADGNTWWYQIGTDPWDGQFYASADAFYNNGATSGSLVNTPFVDMSVPTCGSPPPPPTTVSETTGGITHTWTDYTNAGGSEGASIASNESVQIACAVQGFEVADTNTWWYRIASSPWSSNFYASADAFYNNGQTSGSLHGTPFVDPAVPLCKSQPPPPPTQYVETTGGVTHTWTNYINAGGTQGPSIATNQSVVITCALTGFRVADGDTWWYQIASSPWNNTFYASADAFYNNGATSGSLLGTPFVDPQVPLCPQNVGGGGGTPETTGGPTNTWTNYTNAGGTQGSTIGTNQTVNVSCRLQGFAVADGDTWWYKIASSPWSNGYYASADAFYNNGQTSGSLLGTPFFDPNVPLC
jgi:hypothetical protein